MNATALSLVVIAAVIHAGWNLAAKRIRRGGARFVWAYYSLSAILLVPVMAVSLAVEPQRPQWTCLFAAVVTAVFHVTYGIVLQRGYAVGDLSVVYPVARGTGPLLSVLAAVVLLGERPGVLGLIGAFLVIAGVLVIGTGRAPAHADAADRVARRKGVAYGLLTGVTIAAYTLWDAHSVTGLGVPPIIYFGTGAIVQSLLMAPYALKDREEVAWLWREHKREILIVGLLSPVAYLLVLYALQIAPVSLIAPARELSIVLGGLAAWLVLGEANAVRRLAGSAVVLAGITAIAMA
ncbi:EamA family transporter [Amycolatopsis sp. WAC 01416]|uniref:EamA family transporter n=1 Tax=Amycolatopsis sp. WAC 01416 TaxID=2203196 RepID=UPI000F78D79F|nr:EamA family transporter [Amycolatopsis sp. WAC 01416]RSN30461.1 EamA family transporter [Amycolatopsis sp. WAC 01416]